MAALARRAAALFLGTVILAACGGGSSDALPAVELIPLDDEPELDLDQIDGPAVINLWASTCAPCIRELPAFQSVADQRPDIEFVGINIGEDAETAQAFLDDLGVTFDQYLDPTGLVSTELGITQMPTTFVIDADGKIVSEHNSALDADELTAAIDAAVE